MAGKKLAVNVFVDGNWYGPDGEQDVPADVAKQITNDDAWEQQPAASSKSTPVDK